MRKKTSADKKILFTFWKVLNQPSSVPWSKSGLTAADKWSRDNLDKLSRNNLDKLSLDNLDKLSRDNQDKLSSDNLEKLSLKT